MKGKTEFGTAVETFGIMQNSFEMRISQQNLLK